jgi:hypothetical protein
LSDEKLAATLLTYAEEELSVSARRREVQVVMDTINAEIAGRYRSGDASVDDLLDTERRRNAPDPAD